MTSRLWLPKVVGSSRNVWHSSGVSRIPEETLLKPPRSRCSRGARPRVRLSLADIRSNVYRITEATTARSIAGGTRESDVTRIETRRRSRWFPVGCSGDQSYALIRTSSPVGVAAACRPLPRGGDRAREARAGRQVGALARRRLARSFYRNSTGEPLASWLPESKGMMREFGCSPSCLLPPQLNKPARRPMITTWR